MSGPVTPPLEVSDVADGGSVTGRPITTIEVTDGTLSVSGRTATITTGGGGGSGTVTSITAAADSGTGTAITTSGTFTFTGGTGVTTSVSGTTVTIVADNNGDVTATGTPVDNQLAVWDSATSIEGDANLTWDGSTLTVTGALDIDNIKVDGNTISSTDTDGAIDLSPNGAGVVTMYNAYRFPTAVTSTNDYVLTAQTDGTTAWAEVSGGGSPAGDSTNPKSIQFNDGGSFGGNSAFVFNDSDNNMTIGSGVNYPRLSLVGNNGFVYFKDTGGTTQGSIGYSGSTLLLKSYTDTERLRFASAGQWGIAGANYGTDGQVLTSAGASGAVAWEDVPSASVTFPLEADDGGGASAPSYSFDGDTNTGMFRLTGDTLGFSVGGTAAMYMQSTKIEANKDFECIAGSAASPSLMFASDNDTGLYSAAANKIGFTTGGAQRLALSGTDGMVMVNDTRIYLAAGSLGTPALSFDGDTNTGIYSSGANEVNIVTGGSMRVSINANGIQVGDNTGPGYISSEGTQDLVLTTNELDTAGAIYVKGGANADIELTPNGTGAIEISGAYKLPTAVTSTNDYVLTAQTDGTTAWAEAGGGGGGIGMIYPPVGNSQATGLFHWAHISAPFGTSAATTQSFSTDSPVWVPIIARRTGTFTDMAIQVTSGIGSSALVDLGVYSDSSGQPGTLLGKASVDVETSGEKSGALAAESGESLASVVGTQYWLAMTRRSGVGSFTMQAANKDYLPQWAWTGATTEYGIIVQSGSDNTLPATAAFSSGFAWNMLAIGVNYE